MKHMPEVIVVEIYLRKGAACITVMPDPNNATLGTPTYTVSEAKLLADIIHVTPSYDQLISRAMETSAGLSWRFDTWAATARNVQNTVETVQITDKLGCIDTVVAVHAPYLFNQSPVTYGKWEAEGSLSGVPLTNHYNISWCWPDLGVTKYGFSYDGESMPPEQIKVYDGTRQVVQDGFTYELMQANYPQINNYLPTYNPDHLYHQARALGKLSSAYVGKYREPWIPYWGHTWSAPPTDLQPVNSCGSTNFMMPINFESFPGGGLVDGLNTTRAENVFQLIINYNQALPRPVPLLILVGHEAFVSFTKTAFNVSK